jgi:hypothetical protein
MSLPWAYDWSIPFPKDEIIEAVKNTLMLLMLTQPNQVLSFEKL